MSSEGTDARSENEQRLLALLASELPASSVLLDREYRILSHTRVDARLSASGDALIGRPVIEALAPALVERTQLLSLVETADREEREVASACVQVPLAPGVRTVRVRVAPVDDGEARLLLLVEDVTELLGAEAHAARLASLASAVAHEIRNPLAGISGTLQILASSLDEPRREIVEKAQVQIQRVNTLVQELLAFSRPVAPKRESVELELVAARAIATARAAGSNEAELDGDGRANADAGLLSQVLVSLLQNAHQAGAETVRIEVQDGELRVLDDGPGIPAEHGERIFEPFFTTRTRGTGLGLPMARKIVEAMGGALTACDSALGGAGFRVTLPPADDG